MKPRGFTLVELLVVVGIIGVLSAIVLASLNAARARAAYAAVRSDFAQLQKAILTAQGERNRTLMQLTGSGCSDCAACRSAGDLRNVATSHACYIAWVNILTAIQNAAPGYAPALSNMTRDPWGSPYTVDENEGESQVNPCVQDSMRSVGPDGVWGTSDDYYILLQYSGAAAGCR